MNTFWLHVLNYFFFGFHTVLIVFNLFGWLYPKTRKLHLYSLLITLFSWGVLGIWYGFGYCFLTDWHYQVLRELGETGMPNSYIAFLIEKLTGWLPEARLVNTIIIVLTVMAFIGSVWVNFFRKRK
ncbi:DUF2784 domain-containing protein [Paucihalobacter ruber]|uniref:DUF2784 domain-containing protein n=1 Tax=Paucihalobacter ruber TaxID=2567861 RepID=A0A506PNZ6_9FLAO|nr:DUF2784 domain-containing protein [Paucihalobacter ruber]TPV35636.1 DUF2784 domain-containing protein [Paucihalobacter ruber]